MEPKVKVGVIGAGMYGKVHIAHFQQSGRAEVTWVASRTAESVQEAQQRFGVLNSTTDYREMLSDSQVDAVVISTPPSSHAAILENALAAGKHVLLEKPLAADREGMEHILRAAAQHPHRIVLEASCRHSRLQPKFAFVKNLIDSGKLGEIYAIHHNQLSPTTFTEYNPRGRWSLEKAEAGGGPLFDWGEYDLSFHLGVLGDRPELTGLRSFHHERLRAMEPGGEFSDVEQHAAAFMEFSGGLRYYYERGAGVHNSVESETRIYGHKGGLRFSYLTWDTDYVRYFNAGEDRQKAPREEILRIDFSQHPADDNLLLVDHFLDCLQGKAEPAMPVTLAAKHLNILMRILDG
ncbi:MAG: Gfo/Idh/MocA family protein [Omnitrophica WOR_2 bacterium]